MGVTACAQAVSSDALRDAAKPIEAWMGRVLVIGEGPAPGPIPILRPALFPQPYDFREAQITSEAIYVSMDQIRAFRSSQELAQFLSHAAAHARLGHPARMAEVMTELAVLNTTHAPEQVATSFETRTRMEMEEAAAPIAEEFMQSTGCAPGPCQMFGLLLRAVRRP
jgi:hypothetical protein